MTKTCCFSSCVPQSWQTKSFTNTFDMEAHKTVLWQFSNHIWFAKGHILTSSCSKEAAAGLQPAVKVITMDKIWWKLLWKNATFTYNFKCYKFACIAYLGMLTIPEHTVLMTLIKYCFAWNVFSSHNNLWCLKQVFLKETWDQNFTSAFMTHFC